MMTQGGAHGLDQVQHWMQSVIMHPDGVVAGIGSEAARGQIEISIERVEQVIRRSRRQTSIERLQVYANAYYARLLGCLREEFPATAHALGQETFDTFAFGYLQSYPSQSYTLANLGRHFPRFLAETRPRDLAGDDGSPGWPDFLIDLGTLERIYSEVFDGPGIENRRTLAADDLLQIEPQKWPEAQLIPAPCLRLLTLQYPVHEYVSAVRHKMETRIPEPTPTYLVVTRRDFVVRRRAVSGREFDLLTAMVDGETVGAAIERAAGTPGGASDHLAADLHEWFHSWAAAEYFLAVEWP
jgi:hypothetical protein